MKNWVLILCISLFPAYAFPQNWFAGGSLYVGVDKQENRPQGQEVYYDKDITTSANISISPSIGYKINKFDFGLNTKFGYEYYQRATDETISGGPEILEIGVGLFSRYTFVTFGNYSILGQLGTDYSYKNRMDTPIFDTHRIDIKISPVFEYKLSDRLLLYSNFGIPGIHYTHVFMPKFISSTDYFGFNLPSDFVLSNFSLGFYIIF